MDVNQFIIDRYNLGDLQRAKPPIYIKASRWKELPRLFAALNYNFGAEIGVARGQYSEVLCKNIPGLMLLCVDSWFHYPGYIDTVSQARFDKMYAETKRRLKNYSVNILRGFSVEVAKFVPDKSLDFVYIDAAHDFYHVTQDIYTWERKVRPGGIVAGHDWKRDKGRNWQCHVKDVVSAWAYAYGINPWFVCRGDKSPSWFWVKGD